MSISINPRMAQLPFAVFCDWIGRHYPGEDAAQWYRKLGGHVPHEKHDNTLTADKAIGQPKRRTRKKV